MPLTPAQAAEARRILDTGAWFQALPGEIKESWFRHAVVRRFRKGEVLGLQHLPGDGMLAILEGEVHIVRHRLDGEEVLIHSAGPGFIIAILGVLHEGPLVVTSIATKAGRALHLSRARFELMVQEHPRFYRDVTRQLIGIVDALVSFVADTRHLSAEARVCARLAEMATLRNRDAAPAAGSGCTLPLSQSELARMAGLSRPRANAILMKLAGLGLVSVAFRQIVVRDIGKLQQQAFRASSDMSTRRDVLDHV